jgi:hypothetical protein
MSVSDPWEKIEWGADSEPRKNERVPSSGDSSVVDPGSGDFLTPGTGIQCLFDPRIRGSGMGKNFRIRDQHPG